MGRSAKLHKRVDKKKTLQNKASGGAQTSKAEQIMTIVSLKKKANLKGKARRREGEEGPVLGGADYVDLMMGGRRKARDEAAKLPSD